jgi:hypothetical protein
VRAVGHQLTGRDRRILHEWTALRERASQVNERISRRYTMAYFQAVLLPIELQLNLNDLNIAGEP